MHYLADFQPRTLLIDPLRFTSSFIDYVLVIRRPRQDKMPPMSLILSCLGWERIQDRPIGYGLKMRLLLITGSNTRRRWSTKTIDVPIKSEKKDDADAPTPYDPDDTPPYDHDPYNHDPPPYLSAIKEVKLAQNVEIKRAGLNTNFDNFRCICGRIGSVYVY